MDVLISSLRRLRGSFEPTVTERLVPMSISMLCIGTPLGIAIVDPGFYWPVTHAVWARAPLAVMFALMILLGVYIANKLTQYLEFDGTHVSCRRLGGTMLWQENIDSLREVHLRFGSSVDWVTLDFAGRRRRVAGAQSFFRALAAALKADEG